jgi:hypothetical protein
MVVLTVIAIVGVAAGGLSYRRTRTRVREHHATPDHATLDHATPDHATLDHATPDHGALGTPEQPVDIPPRVVRNGRTERVGRQP